MGDRALFWFNLVGISLAALLLGSFGWFFGHDFVSLMMLLFTPGPGWH